MTECSLVITTVEDVDIESNRCIWFDFHKDAYTPYTTLSCSFIIDESEFVPRNIKFLIGENAVHFGLVDTLSTSNYGGNFLVKLKSRGFTSLLCQNQVTPGMYTNCSLNSLMSDFIDIPNVTHQDCTETSNYIYVKTGSTLWEAIANLGFNQEQAYPFIRGTNEVCLWASDDYQSFVYDLDSVIDYGSCFDYTKIVSDFHMEDVEGTYNIYNFSNQNSQDKNIVRHKHIGLDRQFLSEPIDALIARNKFSTRMCEYKYVKYMGYNGEDLYDIVTNDDLVIPIKRVSIKGNARGIVTQIAYSCDEYRSVANV